MDPLAARVFQRFASSMKLGPGRIDQNATAGLQRMRLVAKNQGDIESAVTSAGFYAKKLHQTMYVYPGNSFGHMVWRASYKPGEYLNPINNTGEKMISVTPDLVVSWHELQRNGT